MTHDDAMAIVEAINGLAAAGLIRDATIIVLLCKLIRNTRR